MAHPEWAGRPYMPSNGTEGMIFADNYCDQCLHQHPDPDKKPQCEGILLKALLGEQPTEWKWNSLGYPTCTAFKKWDWGYDDDDWNEPQPPDPDDPNQLCLPFDILEILGPDLIVTKRAIYENCTV